MVAKKNEAKSTESVDKKNSDYLCSECGGYLDESHKHATKDNK